MDGNRTWERWDDLGVAEDIDQYWITDPCGVEASHRIVLARLTQMYVISPLDKMLEVGCGSGLIHEALVPHVISNSSYVGVDTSSKMLELARKRRSAGQFDYGDIFGLNFPSGSFAMTLCFEVLGHLPEIQKPISELFRVTGRVLIFTVWVSPTGQTLTSTERIRDSEFIHRSYCPDEILAAIRGAAGQEPYSLDIRVLSDTTWAYVVLKGYPALDRPRVLPFWGFTETLIQNYIEVRTNLDAMRRKLDATQSETGDPSILRTSESDHALATCKAGLELAARKGILISHELDSFRHRKLTRLFNRFFDRSNLWNDISPNFQQIKENSLTYNRQLKGYRLQPSINLQRVPFLSYPLDLGRSHLTGILMAPIFDFPPTSGTLGIEIISPSGDRVVQGFLPLSQIDESLPTRFDFPPIQDSNRGRFWLRVFARDLETSVRVLEWRRYSAFGLGKLKRRAFCGFLFQDIR